MAHASTRTGADRRHNESCTSHQPRSRACDGEEPLECIESREEGQIDEAECIDDAWDCGDGALLDSCAPSCGDEIVPCVCTAMGWTCGDGVLAADC